MNELARYLTGLQKSVEVFQRQFGQSAKIRTQIESGLRPVLGIRELQKSLQPLNAARLLNESVAEGILETHQMLADVGKSIAEIGRHFRGITSTLSETVEKILSDLSKNTRRALLTLANHGWYLDLEMPFASTGRLEKALNSGNASAAQRALIYHFRKRLPGILASLKSAYPHRAKIIEAAFKAHMRGEYELSVPLLLAQADGICQEHTKKGIYLKKYGKPEIAEYVENAVKDTLQAALLFPLTQPLPMTANTRRCRTKSGILNRHQVLHGECTDYGTEVNSLKAVSQLNYVAQLLGGGMNP